MDEAYVEWVCRRLVRRVCPGTRIRFSRMNTAGSVYGWDGKSRVLHPSSYGVSLGSAIHDVAHLLVADKSRLCLPEFGLGGDPYRAWRRVSPPVVLSKGECEKEERVTCDLQLCMVKYFGLPVKPLFDELNVEDDKSPTVRLRGVRKYAPHALPDFMFDDMLKTFYRTSWNDRTD